MSSDGLLTTLAQKADPGCAALLVIDVQNDFAADGGFFDQIGADVRSIQTTVIPALIRLVDHARAAGTLVVFVQAIYDPKDLSAPMRERNRRLRHTGRGLLRRVRRKRSPRSDQAVRSRLWRRRQLGRSDRHMGAQSTICEA